MEVHQSEAPARRLSGEMDPRSWRQSRATHMCRVLGVFELVFLNQGGLLEGILDGTLTWLALPPQESVAETEDLKPVPDTLQDHAGSIILPDSKSKIY